MFPVWNLCFMFAPSMEEKEIKILQSAVHVFMRYGVKSVTMDDVARHLGVSKKTLYLYVKDKEDLLNKSVGCFLDNEATCMVEICGRGLNAIDENLEIMGWASSLLRVIHPSVKFDLEKYHPEVASRMAEQRSRTISTCMMSNIKKGQKEGFYRKDFNVDILVKFYIARIEAMFDQNLFPFEEYRLVDLYREMFDHHIRSIATAKGLEYLHEKMKNQKQFTIKQQ